MKARSINILIAAVLVLTAMSIMLLFFLIDADRRFEGEITVEENGITETTIPVRDLALTPGYEKYYDVNLFCRATGSYHVTIEYLEEVDGGMKHFVDTTVEFDGEVIYKGPLTELIDDGLTLNFDTVLDDAVPATLVFRYVMPLETGNEAQGSFADFDISITVKKN